MSLAGPQSRTGIRNHVSGLTFGYTRAGAPFVLAMLGAYILLKPYYLLPSGLPQIADMMLVAALPFALLLSQPEQATYTRRFQYWMMLFCGYAAVVNLSWTFVLMDPRLAMGATFYAFNLSLMIICIRIGMLHPRATFLTIAYAIALSAIIQAASVALTFNAAKLRQIASFNNPNQLGYWSLLSLCMFWSIAEKIKIKWYIQAPTALCLFYTAAASLSKSSMLSIALLSILHFGKRPKMVLLALIAIVPAYLVLENSALVERVSGRLENIGDQKDDNLSARGYIRILYYPEYLLLGAGEGALYRYNDPGTSSMIATYPEIHSTFGTILFSYGGVGSMAFAAGIWCLYRLSSRGRFLFLLPPFLYGLTHQGLRFSFLWLLLALIALLGSTDVRDAPPKKSKAGAAADKP